MNKHGLFPYTAIAATLPLATADLWNLQHINAPSFWAKTQGDGTVVAVIDTGLDVSHPDFTGRIIGARNFTREGDGPGDVFDADGHGTHVAGIIAGEKTGVAPQARIMPLKVFGQADGFQFQEAFRYVLEWNKTAKPQDRVRVVNCSWGGPYDALVNYFIRQLTDQGVVVVVAAGNAGDGKPDTDEIFSWPGFLWEPITVGATDRFGQPAGYSSSYDGIDIGAPGTGIYSTWPGGGYKILSGTSMAAPHVAGGLALLFAWTLRREGWVPALGIDGLEYLERTLFNHVKITKADDRFVGRGILDLTFALDRWPLFHVQVGAFYYPDKADRVQAALGPSAGELKLGTPFKVQY